MADQRSPFGAYIAMDPYGSIDTSGLWCEDSIILNDNDVVNVIGQVEPLLADVFPEQSPQTQPVPEGPVPALPAPNAAAGIDEMVTTLTYLNDDILTTDTTSVVSDASLPAFMPDEPFSVPAAIPVATASERNASGSPSADQVEVSERLLVALTEFNEQQAQQQAEQQHQHQQHQQYQQHQQHQQQQQEQQQPAETGTCNRCLMKFHLEEGYGCSECNGGNYSLCTGCFVRLGCLNTEHLPAPLLALSNEQILKLQQDLLGMWPLPVSPSQQSLPDLDTFAAAPTAATTSDAAPPATAMTTTPTEVNLRMPQMQQPNQSQPGWAERWAFLVRAHALAHDRVANPPTKRMYKGKEADSWVTFSSAPAIVLPDGTVRDPPPGYLLPLGSSRGSGELPPLFYDGVPIGDNGIIQVKGPWDGFVCDESTAAEIERELPKFLPVAEKCEAKWASKSSRRPVDWAGKEIPELRKLSRRWMVDRRFRIDFLRKAIKEHKPTGRGPKEMKHHRWLELRVARMMRGAKDGNEINQA